MVTRRHSLVISILLCPVGVTACGAARGEQRQEGVMQQGTIDAVLERNRERVMAVPGVVGMAVGDCAGERCIKVFVNRKTPEVAAQVPPTLEGVPVAIEETGEVRALEPR